MGAMESAAKPVAAMGRSYTDATHSTRSSAVS